MQNIAGVFNECHTILFALFVSDGEKEIERGSQDRQDLQDF